MTSAQRCLDDGCRSLVLLKLFAFLHEGEGARGGNLRRRRVRRGLSQEILAVDAGIERTYVSRLERGLENPTIAILERLSKALSADIADFFVRPSPAASQLPSRRPATEAVISGHDLTPPGPGSRAGSSSRSCGRRGAATASTSCGRSRGGSRWRVGGCRPSTKNWIVSQFEL